MRFSVDFTPAIGDLAGIGTYTLELVRAMLALAAPDEIRLAVHAFRHPGWRAKIRERLGATPPTDVNRMIPHGVLLRAERWLRGPKLETLFGKTDVFHGTNYLAPPARRARTVITIHDLAFVRMAEEVPVPHRYARHVGDSVRRASRIIAVSDTTRREVIETFDVDPQTVVTVPLGAPQALPAAPDSERRDALRRWRLPERYFLFTGTLEPRKNLPRLIRAFGRAASRFDEPTGLLLAGRRGWATEEIDAEIRRCPAPVAAPGWLEAPLKNALLGRAIALVMPSLWEGFGLPVLEAFVAKTPVIAANAGALPEVAGEAALLVDPRNEESLAEGLVRIVGDRSLSSQLVSRGQRRAREFTWERTARETLEVYRNA